MHGLILAGGQGTRLGPLGLQRSKALVSVGGRPMLVHQYQQLKRAGCDEVRIVVSPRTEDQVKQVIKAAGLDVYIVTQASAGGPPAGIIAGTSSISDRETIMLFADTFIEDKDIPCAPNTTVIAPAPTCRKYCYDDGKNWQEGVVGPGTPVFVGALRHSTHDLHEAAWAGFGEDAMATVLNNLSPNTQIASTWLDAGDVAALTQLNRQHFISRSFNKLSIDEDGIITKTGRVKEEYDAIATAPRAAQHLYPRVYSYTPDMLPSYRMEYVPLPSLAELYLYWPRDESMWKHITTTLLSTLDRAHWPTAPFPLARRPYEVYQHGLRRRYEVHSALQPSPHWQDSAVVNGERMVTGSRLIDGVCRFGKHMAFTAEPGIIHGDPNFTNVLWSLETSTFRLLDPRGEWGGHGSLGDKRYDVAKVAYSPIFAKVAHGLFEVKHEGGGYKITNLELDPVVSKACERYATPQALEWLTGFLLLAGAPLHQGDEATIMYLTGARMMQRFV